MIELTKEEFLKLREINKLTFSQIGQLYGLTERQVNYRVKQKWNLNYQKKKYLDEKYFKTNTLASNYWAGVLAADGWIEEERERIGLAFKSSDIAHLEKFKSALNSQHDICPFMNGQAYRIRFNSLEMVNDLRNIFNITGKKTYTYKMPLFEDNELMWSFLRGYIDGDGCYYTRYSSRPALSLCSAQESFLLEFREICSIALDKSIIQKIYLNINKKGQCYNFALTLEDSAKVINLLYKNSTESTRLDRKYLKIQSVLR